MVILSHVTIKKAPDERVCCVFCSVYSGHQSILIPPVELESNPALWLLAVSQLRVRDTFCSYSVMELCTKGLGLQTEALKVSTTLTQHVNSSQIFDLCDIFKPFSTTRRFLGSQGQKLRSLFTWRDQGLNLVPL